MHHSHTTSVHLSPTGALMDPDYLRSTLRPFSASRDLDLVINKAALTVCAIALLGIAMSLLARIG